MKVFGTADGQLSLNAITFTGNLVGIYEEGVPLTEENYIVLDLLVMEAGP